MTTKTGKTGKDEDPKVTAEQDAAEDELVELLERLVRKARAPRREAGDETESDEAGTEAEDDELEAEEAETGDVLEDDADDEERPAPVRGGRLLTVVTAVLAFALAAAATTAVVFWRQYDNVSSAQDARQEVAERAGLIARTMYNYDYHHTQDYLNAQAKVLTKATAANVKQNLSTLSTFINTGQIVSTAQINQIYVGEISGGKATVIVDISTRLTTTKGISNLANVLDKFQLVREHGVWLASGSPQIVGPGTEKDTDLSGKPLASASPSPSASPTKK